MAPPLTGSIFKPTDFDRYLEEIGLGDLSPEARIKLVDTLHESVQYRIVTEVLSSLSTQQKLELARLMQEANKTGEDTPVNDYLLKQIPDVEGLVDDIIEQEKRKLRPGAATLQKVLDEYFTYAEKRQRYEEAEENDSGAPKDSGEDQTNRDDLFSPPRLSSTPTPPVINNEALPLEEQQDSLEKNSDSEVSGDSSPADSTATQSGQVISEELDDLRTS